MEVNLIEAGTGYNGTYSTDKTLSYNAADGDVIFYVRMSDLHFSLHSILESLTGTLDGVINIYVGNVNDIAKAAKIQTVAITQTNFSHLFVKEFYTATYVFIEYVFNGITGGTVKNILVSK